MLSRLILRAGLYFIGIAAILIGGAIACLGIEIVGRFFTVIINLALDAGPMTDLGQPNDDSELRFYSIFFIAYGVVLTRAANNIDKHRQQIPLLLGLFFAGGLARTLSYVMIGPPHSLFILLMVIELVFPPVLWLLWRQSNPASNTPP